MNLRMYVSIYIYMQYSSVTNLHARMKTENTLQLSDLQDITRHLQTHITTKNV